MCGIVGVIAKGQNGLFTPQDDSFYQMLYADALRGFDSTGIIGVEANGQFHIAKEAVPADWFTSQFKVNHKEIADRIYQKGKLVIGHNRKRTLGEVKDTTAHPFVVDNWFAMVHNGTLTNHNQLAKTEVDSEALAIHLSKAIDEAGEDMDALKPELDKALGDVYGAYAIAAYDQKRHRAFLLRNSQRPLSVIETENAWYFMSEPRMGAWILTRNGHYKYENLKADHLKEHELWVMDLDTNTLRKEQLVPKKSHTHSSTQRGWVTTPTKTGTTKATAAERKESVGQTGKFMPEEGKELKRFRRNWLGKRITFWADDYLEKNFPKTVELDNETEITLMGGLDDVDYRHTLLGDIDMAALQLNFIEDVLDKKWTGVIESIGRTKAGVVQLYLKDGSVKPMVESLPKKKELEPKVTNIKDAKDWRGSLRTKLSMELIQFLANNMKLLQTWQITAINSELAFRNGITSIEQAQTVCRNRSNGDILVQKQVNGKFVYTDSMGHIYYETAIAVH